MPFDEIVTEMLGGPGHLRFLVEPTVALLLGVRDGRLDAAAGRPPYGLAVVTAGGRQARRELLGGALRAVATVLAVAITLDLVLQYLIFGSVRLWLALVVGTILVALPYTLARGLSNRVSTGVARHRRSPGEPTAQT